MRMLDLYCGAGGAAAGYAACGFKLVGVDNRAQQNYPYTFVKCSSELALELFDLSHFDAIHASPPCQTHSVTRYRQEDRPGDPDELARLRARLIATTLPFIIENVPGAPLIQPVLLCGSMFSLDVRRHRLFEANFPIPQPACQHERQLPRFPNPDHRRPQELVPTVNVHGSLSYAGEGQVRKDAMQIHWMSTKELTQAIPPAYTRHVARALIDHLASL